MSPDIISPLSGKTIVLTRAKEQQIETRKMFEENGARVLDFPSIVIQSPDEWGPLDDALAELEDFNWLVFSSSNGVKAVEARLQIIGKSLATSPKTLKIAAVGRSTAKLLKDLDASIDFVPPEFVADSLIKNFPVSGWGLRILIPRVQSGGRNILSDAFSESGARVVEVAAYESNSPTSIPEETLQAFLNYEVEAITFTSGKTVINSSKLLSKNLGTKWQQYLTDVKLISIGPQTTIACKKAFNRVDREAEIHNISGLIKACIDCI